MNCPKCGIPDVEFLRYSEAVDRSVYQCNSCKKRFRVDSEGARMG